MRGAKARRKDERRKGETQRRKKKKKKKKKKVRELDALLPLKGLCASIMFRPLLDGALRRLGSESNTGPAHSEGKSFPIELWWRSSYPSGY